MAGDNKPIEMKPIDLKSVEMKPAAKPTSEAPESTPASGGLARETRLGLAVAGSFAVMVGGIFGVKQLSKSANFTNEKPNQTLAKLEEVKPVKEAPVEPFPENPGEIKIDLSHIPKMPEPEVKKPTELETPSLNFPDLKPVNLPEPTLPASKPNDLPESKSLNLRPTEGSTLEPSVSTLPPLTPGNDDFSKSPKMNLIKPVSFDEPIKPIDPPLKEPKLPDIKLPGGGDENTKKPTDITPPKDLAPLTIPSADSIKEPGLPPINTSALAIPKSPENNGLDKKPELPPLGGSSPELPPIDKTSKSSPELSKTDIPKLDIPKVDIPKLGDDAPETAPKKDSHSNGWKSLDTTPLDGGSGTIKSIPKNTELQPTPSNLNKPIDIKMESSEIKPEPSRTTIKVPARTMENREPGTVPTSSATRSTNRDYDEDWHDIKADDSYAAISKKYYDDASYAKALQAYNEANPSSDRKKLRIPPIWVLEQNHGKFVPVSNIKTTSLTTPASDRRDLSPPPSVDNRDEKSNSNDPFASLRVYTVQGNGETLKDIARRVLGNENAWQSIKKYNISVNESSELPVGTKLYMPPGTP